MPAGVVAGIALFVILTVVILACVAEREAHKRLQAKLVQMCAGVLGTDPTVALAGRSVLVQLARRRLTRVDIDTPAATASPNAMLVSGRADGVAPVENGLQLDALAATATLRLSWIRHVVEAVQAGNDAGGIAVRSVSLVPKRRSLVMTVSLPVAFGIGVDLRVVIAVSLKDGKLVFRATDLSMPFTVLPVPIPVAWAIDSWIVQLRPQVIPPALDALTIRAIRWEKKSVTLDLTARNVTVPLPA